MADIILKVSPEDMKKKAEKIQAEIDTMRKNWNRIDEIIGKSRSYWEGAASLKHKHHKSKLEDDWSYILNRLKEHPEDLLKMAGVYEKSTQKAKKLANVLPKDVIY